MNAENKFSQFLPSLAYAISITNDGSENAQMHCFYLRKLQEALLAVQTPQQPSITQLHADLRDTWDAFASHGVYLTNVEFETTVAWPLGESKPKVVRGRLTVSSYNY